MFLSVRIPLLCDLIVRTPSGLLVLEYVVVCGKLVDIGLEVDDPASLALFIKVDVSKQTLVLLLLLVQKFL